MSVYKKLNKKTIPSHVAIIMDGMVAGQKKRGKVDFLDISKE